MNIKGVGGKQGEPRRNQVLKVLENTKKKLSVERIVSPVSSTPEAYKNLSTQAWRTV